MTNESNALHLVQGSLDIPLDETGKAQAEALGQYFTSEGITFDEVWCSPLVRAELVSPGGCHCHIVMACLFPLVTHG